MGSVHKNIVLLFFKALIQKHKIKFIKTYNKIKTIIYHLIINHIMNCRLMCHEHKEYFLCVYKCTFKYNFSARFSILCISFYSTVLSSVNGGILKCVILKIIEW